MAADLQSVQHAPESPSPRAGVDQLLAASAANAETWEKIIAKLRREGEPFEEEISCGLL